MIIIKNLKSQTGKSDFTSSLKLSFFLLIKFVLILYSKKHLEPSLEPCLDSSKLFKISANIKKIFFDNIYEDLQTGISGNYTQRHFN